MSLEAGSELVSPQETVVQNDEPIFHFKAGHADRLYSNETVRNILTRGGVNFPEPNDKGHIETAISVPISVINSVVTMYSSLDLTEDDFGVFQDTVQQEVRNTPTPDASLTTYDKALIAGEALGEEKSGTMHDMIRGMARDVAETRRKYEMIALLNSRLLPPGFEMPDMVDFDKNISRLNERAEGLGVEMQDEE